MGNEDFAGIRPRPGVGYLLREYVESDRFDRGERIEDRTPSRCERKDDVAFSRELEREISHDLLVVHRRVNFKQHVLADNRHCIAGESLGEGGRSLWPLL